ncbi:MAG: ribonuclease HI [Anaerolineaceae bacterium]|nr:ribonuclease HI [Anaerolineaceae bacterium]
MRGERPGIYTYWSGEGGAEEQVREFAGALYKGFHAQADAARWLRSLKLPVHELPPVAARLLDTEVEEGEIEAQVRAASGQGKVILFTDGACRGNPGPGGYGAVLLSGKHRKEISGGYRRTTNNRMEMMACIMGLKQLKQPSSVVVFSDSHYLVDGMSGGKALKWRAAGWLGRGGQAVKNADLWDELLALCEIHEVGFNWIKGHAAYPENMRCDVLAVQAAKEAPTGVDIGFEKKKVF